MLTQTIQAPSKHKGGRPVGTTKAALLPKDPNIIAALDKHIKYNKLFKILYKEAMGGQVVTNGNGVTFTTQPNLDVIKYLIDQRFGKAVTRDEKSDTGSEAMKKLQRIEQYILPKRSAVTAEGKVVENEAVSEPGN